MQVTIATDRAPGQGANEDFAGAIANAVVLLDGAGLSGVDDGGCVHGVAWYAHRLGSLLLANLADGMDAPLADLLARAIAEVAASHTDTCDLTHPGTPSATVVALREHGGNLDYLVLADSTLVLDIDQVEPTVVTDRREAEIGRRYRSKMDSLVGGTDAHTQARASYVAAMRAHRNCEEGFYVAAADPEVAKHALTGTVPRDVVRRALLLSDGASRLADRFGQQTWKQALDLVAADGPRALIDAVRAAENADRDGRRWPRGKIYDDATAVLCNASA
jgi:hypothetical protein